MEDIWKKYDKIGNIGAGSFGDVYKAKNKSTSEYVAIKEIKKMKIKTNETILNEIKIMKKLKSENSVSLIETINSKLLIIIVLKKYVSFSFINPYSNSF